MVKKRKGEQTVGIGRSDVENSYLNEKSPQSEHRRTSLHRAASQSSERLLLAALLLWPVGRFGNKAVTEKADWLCFGGALLLRVRRENEDRHGIQNKTKQ